ncbi:MAG: bifunctional glycosyltransferase/class I SAM-dependent methyltransferase [Humibacillus sp.]|nr:bifunctional glycosyltransferase/class I SAM-dependent methyltransferase [Humibacillus sp.]MDN5778908.1 bifunctional glycosyltransferase/class I SAM-dependent methyltransferase [Humibacillus sp.]
MSAAPMQVLATATETVVVLAKSPVPGKVKTRLTPTFTAAEAAALATAAIRDTLAAVADAVATGAVRQTVIAWDGPVTAWLPREARVLAQRGKGLDERLQNIFDDLLAGQTDQPTLLVGMDTPQVRAVDLDIDWGDADAVLGMSYDGGYWCIGLRCPQPGAIRGVPMSTDHTGADQLRRLRLLGLRVRLLPTLLDVDEPADARAVAALAPDSRFGRLHRRLTETPCHPSTLFDAAMGGVEVRVHRGPLHRADDTWSAGVGCRPLDVSAWSRMSSADELFAARCEGPVLDIGCGPGRFVEALASRGIPVLGVDISRSAIDQTSQRGVCALFRDINDRLPGEGRWGTVLLADGNIGIGGDPLSLLRRCRELVRAGAMALVEISPDDAADEVTTLTLHDLHGRRSAPLPWSVIGARRLVQLAALAGFVPVEDWRVDGRAFVALRQAG